MYYRIFARNDFPILQMNSIEYAAAPEITQFGPGKRDKFLMCYVLSGSGAYNGTMLTKGQGFLVTPDIVEHIYPNKDDPWELLWFMSADPKMWDLLKYYNADPETLVFRFCCFDELEELKQTVISNSMKMESSAVILYHYLSILKNHMVSEKSAADGSARRKYIEFAVNYIEANYEQNITVSKLTTLLGVSQPYLYKIFKEAFGKSPKQYLTDYRIAKAKLLLLDKELIISEVACSVGLEDVCSFSKFFSKREGVSPTEYRRRNNIE